MANNPSPKSQHNRGHVRKPTPILPALPLSLSDKAWRRPSEIAPIAEEESFGPIATVPDPKHNYVEPQSHQLQNGTTDEQPDLRHENDVLPPHPEAAEEKETTNKDDKSSTDEASTKTEEPEQASEPSVVETARVTEPKPEDAPQVVSEPTERVEASTEVSNLEPSAVIEVKKVQIVDRDGLPSDHDQSSVDPSSISAATDHSSVTGESALETVVDDSSHISRNPALSHRKSEAAPEALANGFSPRSIHERNGSQPIVLPQAAPPKPAPLPSIHEHLLSLASTKQFFDTVIYINHPDTSLQPSEHFSHSLFLCRSELFAKILAEIDPSIHPKVINLYPSRNVLSHAFEAALRFFYSDHVLTTQTLMPQAAYQNRQAKQYTFEYIMSYWIAGVELGLLPIKTRAHEMVQDLISWDLADVIGKEVHDLRYAEEAMQDGHNKFEVREIANSLTRLLARRLFAQLDLVNIDPGKTAQSLSLPTRFSALEYPRSNNPALSSMVFGSLPSEQTNAPNPISIMISTLTNLSFLDLSIVVDEIRAIYGLPGENFVRQVIEIREANRDHVINNRSIPNKQRVSNSSAWEPAGHREYLDEYGRLSRERVGFLLPIRDR